MIPGRARRDSGASRQIGVGCPPSGAGSGQERTQAVVLLAAGRAAVEVRAHPRDPSLRVAALELELDVFVEPLEALLAADVRTGRAEQLLQALVALGHRFSFSR